ncbi:hypothetical protein BJY01DRAFT_85154 [Aspergillus pseudoustus]|uniref:Uncharacterized protein n=1 Tax=Aspergillus pseudoustus TaxID=1810923 RepID=A0ABR4J4Z3_9EURO
MYSLVQNSSSVLTPRLLRDSHDGSSKIPQVTFPLERQSKSLATPNAVGSSSTDRQPCLSSFSRGGPDFLDLPIIQRPEGIQGWGMTKSRKGGSSCPAKAWQAGRTKSQAPLNSIVDRSCRSPLRSRCHSFWPREPSAGRCRHRCVQCVDTYPRTISPDCPCPIILGNLQH